MGPIPKMTRANYRSVTDSTPRSLPVSKGWTTPFWLQRLFPQLLLRDIIIWRQLPFLLFILALLQPLPDFISSVVSHSISTALHTFHGLYNLLIRTYNVLTYELDHEFQRRWRHLARFCALRPIATDSVHGWRWSKSTTCSSPNTGSVVWCRHRLCYLYGRGRMVLVSMQISSVAVEWTLLG